MPEPAALRRRIEELTGRPAPRAPRVFTDTTEFMAIARGDVVSLEGRLFLVRGDMREGRFGLDEDPKFWVKSALCLETGAEKILKLVFHEEFRIRVGLLAIRCRRDPEKEAAVLDAVRGDRRFMQGETRRDEAGNPVRVIDFIRGGSLYDQVRAPGTDHREWCRARLPGVLARLLPAVEAIRDLHARGFRHGDVRNDHLIVDAETGEYRWIDFDLEPDVPDFDVWSLGNVLLLAIGAGEHTFRAAAAGRVGAPAPGTLLGPEDASAFFAHRVMNLRKLFPWVPSDLNDVLLHFSFGTDRFYETVEEILADLAPAAARLAAEAAP